MKNGLVIADAGSIFSLALIDKLDLLDKLFIELLNAILIQTGETQINIQS